VNNGFDTKDKALCLAKAMGHAHIKTFSKWALLVRRLSLILQAITEPFNIQSYASGSGMSNTIM
jgi:hypothetical protein